jgi:hypothetical protein
MRNYRSLFEQEFASDPRIRDIAGTGLPLGVQTLSIAEALELLAARSSPPESTGRKQRSSPKQKCTAADLEECIRSELRLLRELKDMLTGFRTTERLEALLLETDYLWAHFPDCAGTGPNSAVPGRGTDLGFLKRVRTEIDPFERLWEMSLRELHLV